MSLIARVLGITFLVGAASCPAADTPPPACSALETAAARASAALIAHVEPGGRLRYRESADGRILPGYNVVRHAGVLYALADLDAHALAPESRMARDRASRYLASCCLRPVMVAPDAWAIWSDAEGHPEYAKLGASGLALAAWTALHAQGASAPSLEHLRGLGRFLMAMQDESGLFHMRYHAREGRLRRASLYYPGEAALGLYQLAQLDPDGPWRTAADRAVVALADMRQISGEHPPDHWLLIATQGYSPENLPVDWRAPLLDALLVEDLEQGALTRDARTAPTATRMEGLAAAYTAVSTDAQRQRIRRALARGGDWLMSRQDRDGAFGRGGVGARAGERRIDTTQHALSALRGARAAGACQPD